MRSPLPESTSPSWLLLGRAAALLLAFVTAPVIARAIGPEGRGLTAFVIALSYLLPIAMSLGVPFEIRRAWSSGVGASATRASRILSAIAFVPSGIVAALLWSTIFAPFDFITRFAAALVIFLTPLGISWICDTSALVATHRFRSVFLLQVAQPFLQLVGIAGLWITGFASSGTVLLAYVGGLIVSFSIGLFVVRTENAEIDNLMTFVRRALPYWGSASLEAAANRVDQVLALPVLGAGPAGIYSVATSLGALPLAFGHAITGAYFPSIVKDPTNRTDSPTMALIRESLVLGTLAAIGGFLIVPWLIPLLFGQDFSGAIAPTIVALAGAPFILTIYAATQALGAQGRGHKMTILQVCYLALGLFFFLLLASNFGVVGAAIGMLAAALGAALVSLFLIGCAPSAAIPKRSDIRRALISILRGHSA